MNALCSFPGAFPRKRRFLAGMLGTEIPGRNGGRWMAVLEQRATGSNTSKVSKSLKSSSKKAAANTAAFFLLPIGASSVAALLRHCGRGSSGAAIVVWRGELAR